MTARTPDELESLLEDAVVLRDAVAVSALFEPGGVLAVFRWVEEEPTMHTMLVRMSTDPGHREDVVAHLRDDIVPWARSRPGFVSGQWLLTADGTEGSGVVVFDSAEAAERAAEGPRTYARDDARAWNIESVAVYEQVAAADGAVATG